MDDDDDPAEELEARLEAVRARTRASIPSRVVAIEDALVAHRGGDAGAGERLRRLAHQLRGIAEEAPLRAAAETVELAATDASADLDAAVGSLSHLMKGRAPVASQDPPRGAEVAAEASPVRTPSGPTARTRSLSVLVVDDTEALRKLSRLALERMGGHSVVEASSPVEALAAAEHRTFDVVLLDAMMPGGSGVDLAVRMRERLPQAKLVILSAATEAQLAPNGHVADAWWQKPLAPVALIQRVAALVESV